MISAMNMVVQALVWTTCAGLLYAVWLNSRAGSSAYRFNLTFYWDQTVNLLRTMWVLLAISLIISLLVFAWPKSGQAAPNAGNPCVSTTYPAQTIDVAQSANNQCGNANNSAPR